MVKGSGYDSRLRSKVVAMAPGCSGYGSRLRSKVVAMAPVSEQGSGYGSH